MIKGSEGSLLQPDHYLTRQDYVELKASRETALSERAEDVYTLFERYMRIKQDNMERDVADRYKDNLLLSFETETKTIQDARYHRIHETTRSSLARC